MAGEIFRKLGPGEIDPAALTVKEIREYLMALEAPDPALLSVLSRDPRKTVRRLTYRWLNRTGNLAANEDIFRRDGVSFIAGADEAGRGALAGPLVAAAVMFAPGTVIEDVDDSKALSPSERESLYSIVLETAECVSVSFVSPGLIDRWGIQMSNLKALGDAVAGLDGRCQCVICDHFALKGCGVPAYGMPMADGTFQSVAAASIVAKVERDRLMRSLHKWVPLYNFKDNKGYGTPEHLEALAASGPSRLHRLSFKGVRPELEESPLWSA